MKIFPFLSYFGSLESFKLMFHNHVYIDIAHLHPIQSQVQSQKNSQGYILCSTFLSLPPTVASSWLCLVYRAFWLVVWIRPSVVALLDVLADGEDQYLSSELYKRTIGSPTTLFFILAEVCSPVLDSSTRGGFAMVASAFLSSMAK